MKAALCALSLLLLAPAAMAEYDSPEIRSRVLGKGLRETEQACRSNLQNFCQQKNLGLAANVTFEILGENPQFNVRCKARCKLIEK